MQLEDFFEFVEPNYTRIKGHRIGIESIITKYLAGQTLEEIARQYDTLRLIDIYATITYYLQNKEAVDAYLSMCALTSKPGDVVGPAFLPVTRTGMSAPHSRTYAGISKTDRRAASGRYGAKRC